MNSILKSNPKAYSKWLQGCGIDEDTADLMAGYDSPRKVREARRAKWVTIGASILLVLTCTFLTAVAFWSSITKSHADELGRSTEGWFVACLNGMTIQVGDTLYQCLPAGRAPK